MWLSLKQTNKEKQTNNWRIWGFWCKFTSETTVPDFKDRANDAKNVHPQTLCKETGYTLGEKFCKVFEKNFNAFNKLFTNNF